jgi:hypothetical protein
MQKLDLKKDLKHLYQPSPKEVSIVDVPELQFIFLDGRIGVDETPQTSPFFQEALGVLYGMSYTLKFMSKKRAVDPVDYGVMALEGLWWTDSGAFDLTHREPWNCTLMIVQPEHITGAMFQEALQELGKKKPNPYLGSLRLERFREGLSIQMMHVGPYAAEARTLARMKTFAAENGYGYRGKHHEIYIGDPRRSQPEKLRTVLRQPVEKIDPVP